MIFSDNKCYICGVITLLVMFVRTKRTGANEYLQIVQNYREGGKTKQRLIGTLGRVDEIGDDGAGIPASLLPRIFDPFVTSRMGRGGTGLGLHIAHNIAANVLGGRISVTSIEGSGTVFELEIPLVAPLPAANEEATGQPA